MWHSSCGKSKKGNFVKICGRVIGLLSSICSHWVLKIPVLISMSATKFAKTIYFCSDIYIRKPCSVIYTYVHLVLWYIHTYTLFCDIYVVYLKSVLASCFLVLRSTPFWPRTSPAGVNQVQRPESVTCSQTWELQSDDRMHNFFQLLLQETSWLSWPCNSLDILSHLFPKHLSARLLIL